MNTQGQFVISEKQDKKLKIAFLLWFFLGGLGAHQFYIGNLKKGFLYVFLYLLSVMNMIISSQTNNTLFTVIGYALVGVLVVLGTIDLFTLSQQITDAENKLSKNY